MNRRIIVLALLMFGTLVAATNPAQANAGTVLVWANIFHLVVGNVFIGILEGRITSFLIKEAGNEVIYIGIVIANFVSLLSGYYWLPFIWQRLEPFTLGHSLLTYGWLHIGIMFLIAFAITLAIEWPFYHLAIYKGTQYTREEVYREGDEAPTDLTPLPPVRHYFPRQTWRVALLANIASYLLLTAFYWLCSDTSLLTRTYTVPVQQLAVSDGIYAYYYPNLMQQSDVYRIRFDGSAPRKCPYTSEQLLKLLSPGNRHAVIENQFGPHGRAIDTLLEKPGAWEFSTGFWPSAAIRAGNQTLNTRYYLGLETPFLLCRVRNAILLPGDKALMQIHRNGIPAITEIAVMDLPTRRIAHIAIGYYFLIVRDGERFEHDLQRYFGK